ncbi:MAG TPA: fibrobacter succinogenes major paralogous domain-containing protein [bacterium]|nr:fibrobacter succinogenes major paralogous domain-containing protein [bacterium]
MKIGKGAMTAWTLIIMAMVSYSQSEKTVTIADLEWMADNLAVSVFRNGDAIPQAKTSSEWQKAGQSGEPAWCYYENDATNGRSYGKLYNWFAVNDPRNLAPKGWHVASFAEWKSLLAHYGSDDLAGGPLKETGTKHWKSPNTGASDKDGFHALPGGYRDGTGLFTRLGYYATFWTSTACSRNKAWGRHMSRGDAKVYQNCIGKEMGFSVRCVRDYAELGATVPEGLQ